MLAGSAERPPPGTLCPSTTVPFCGTAASAGAADAMASARPASTPVMA